MTVTLNKAAAGLLAEIVAATASVGNGFVVLNAPATKSLLDAQLIEVNEGVKNDAGEVGARATEAGKAYTPTAADAGQEQGAAGSAPAPAAKPAKRTFSIDTGVTLPPKEKVSTRAERYPFSQLPIGGSFFVADADVTSGNAYSTLSSTVATYNLKFSEETGDFRAHRRDANKQVPVRKPLRHFELRKMDDNGVPGARVFRTEVPEGDAAQDGEE